jgi:thioredoxin-related protein
MTLRVLLVRTLCLSLGLCAGLSPALAGSPPAAPQKKEAVKKAAAPARATPAAPIFDSDAIGRRQIADYQKVAQDSGRRLLLVFGTNECGPCRAFNGALHEKKFFAAFINQFVPVYIDVSSGTNASLLADYNVNPAAEQPGIVILMPDARIVDVLAQGEMAALARKGDSAVQEFFLTRFLKTEK